MEMADSGWLRGGQRVRLADIAQRAGVSPQAVSVVLRNGGSSTMRIADRTAQRIRRIAEELNYWPNLVAQQLRGRECGLIGVLIGACSTTANFLRLAAIEQEAYHRQQRLLIGQFHEDHQTTPQYLSDFLSRGIDRLVCFHNSHPHAYDEHSLKLLRQFRNLVFQTHSPVEWGHVVDVDRAQGVAEAVEYLVRTGRRRIAMILNDSPARDPLMNDRKKGYCETIEKMDNRFPMIWTGDGTFPPSRDLAAQAVRYLLDQGADAVIASNDVWAVELIRCLRHLGKQLPQDMAVIGFDNTDAASLADPTLTTIDQNYSDFASATLDLLQSDSPFPPQKRWVRPRLIYRESA